MQIKEQDEKCKQASITEGWKPQPMWVYSNENEGDDGQDMRGLWKNAPGVEPEEHFDNWKPQQVVIYPPGKEPGAKPRWKLRFQPDMVVCARQTPSR